MYISVKALGKRRAISKLSPIVLVFAAIVFRYPVEAADQNASMADGGVRKWPPKTSRVFVTDEQIARIRRLCRTDKRVAAILTDTVEQAKTWVAIPCSRLREILPDGRVWRDFDVSARGCPVHGNAVFKHGTYPWKLDPGDPFKLICPVGGERYPSNDFGKFYRDGMKDRSLLTGLYADDGRGWQAPDGEKYCFVSYACHWNWQHRWIPAVTKLAHAYVLTGNRLYAEKTIAMLDRIAEVYPGMDYSRQSHFADVVGSRYKGKICNHSWETDVLRELSVAYDLVFDCLTGSNAVALPWRSAEQIRANIEVNYLEEGIAAVERQQVYGNFGKHQSALAYAVVVRQNGPTKALLEGVFTQTGGSPASEGMNYALYNLVYKDGMPNESSPFYSFMWLDSLIEMVYPLSLAGFDLYTHSKIGLMLDAPLRLICAGEFTPAVGDAGGINDHWIGPKLTVYTEAWRRLGQPQYAWAVRKLSEYSPPKTLTFDQLLSGTVTPEAKPLAVNRPPAISRLLDGYGLAILNNAKDTLAVSAYYGIRGGHGHFDRLNIELFGQNRRLSPDLGYPDAMNTLVPGISSWTKNTVSHNCVVVDDRRQEGNLAGRVLRFHNSPKVHVVDIDAAGSYKKADVYRRTLVLVETDEDNAYLVDVFRVRGGNRHVLSLHGQEGKFKLDGMELSEPQKTGTLAGPDVAYGVMYDDPKLASPGPNQKFGSYSGSGYQHLFNCQRGTQTGTPIADWSLAGKPRGRIRAHLPANQPQEVIVADAFVSPRKRTSTVLKYVLLDRTVGEVGNTFVTVWEMGSKLPFIDQVQLHKDPSLAEGADETIVLSIKRGVVDDIVAIAPTAGRKYKVGDSMESDAAVVALTVREGLAVNAFAAGGSYVSASGDQGRLSIPATIKGKVVSANFSKKIVIIEFSQGSPEPSKLSGQSVRFFNDLHSCMYPIGSAAVQDNLLTLKLDGSEVLTGRVGIKSVDALLKRVRIATKLPFPFSVAGMSLVSDDFREVVGIASGEGNDLQLRGSGQSVSMFLMGNLQEKDAWIADFGPGDAVEIELATVNGNVHLNYLQLHEGAKCVDRGG